MQPEQIPEPTVHVYRRARGVARAALSEEPALTEPTALIQRRMVDAAVEAVWPIAVAAGRKQAAAEIRTAAEELCLAPEDMVTLFGGEPNAG